MLSDQVPVSRKSRNFWGDIILFLSWKRKRSKTRNFAVILLFIPFKSCEKNSFTERAGRSFTDGFSDPKRFRDFRQTGRWHLNAGSKVEVVFFFFFWYFFSKIFSQRSQPVLTLACVKWKEARPRVCNLTLLTNNPFQSSSTMQIIIPMIFSFCRYQSLWVLH